jgi:hypothetical protein
MSMEQGVRVKKERWWRRQVLTLTILEGVLPATCCANSPPTRAEPGLQEYMVV